MRTTIAACFFALLLTLPTTLLAAVGCDLNDPDRDVKRLFPESTGYRTTYASIDKKGGTPLLRKVESRLGDKFHGIFETIDVPYTIYEIYQGKKSVGYIHGVNQKGEYGGIQVFLVFDEGGKTRGFYIQKMTSQAAKKLRDKSFAKQFVGLTLRDFETYNVQTGKGSGKIADITNPAPDAAGDFRAILRAAKKNAILMDEFVFSGKGK